MARKQRADVGQTQEMDHSDFSCPVGGLFGNLIVSNDQNPVRSVSNTRVAQLDGAPDFESGGRRFESFHAYWVIR